jgi:hypothetical protein
MFLFIFLPNTCVPKEISTLMCPNNVTIKIAEQVISCFIDTLQDTKIVFMLIPFYVLDYAAKDTTEFWINSASNCSISVVTRCNISSILLEMDRILRPGGRAYIRDLKQVVQDVKEITTAMGWRSIMRDTAEGPYASRKVLMCDKPMVR